MKQFSIITQSRVGIIAELTEALANENINIENIDAKAFEDKAIILISVDDYQKAMKLFDSFEGFQVVAEDAIIVKLKNEPGALAKIARRFSDANIDLKSIRFVQRNEDYGLVAISVERTDAALALVKDVLVS